MNAIRFGEALGVRQVIAPVAFTTSAVASTFVDGANAQWLTFLVGFGLMTSDSTDIVTVTVECCPIGTTTDGTEEVVKFDYRLSPAVATSTDPLGEITAATSAGVAVTASADDSKFLLIDIDPATIPAQVTSGRFFRIVATPSDAVASGVIDAYCFMEPRYAGNAIAEIT